MQIISIIASKQKLLAQSLGFAAALAVSKWGVQEALHPFYPACHAVALIVQECPGLYPQ